MSKLKWNDEAYINRCKQEIGFNFKSNNITVMNKGNFLQRRFALLELFLTMYNLSIEKNGLLLIKRNKLSPKLDVFKSTFIESHQIDKILLKKRLGYLELFIKTKLDEKYVFKFSPKSTKFLPWQTAGVNELKRFISNYEV